MRVHSVELKGRHVLVVEDDPALSLQVRNFLAAQELDVVVASTGAQAADLLSGKTFDLVLLDWKLPDGEGVDICRTLRERGVATPVLMLTAEAELDNKIHGFASGVDDYLTKPFAPRELLARIKTLLARPPAAATDEFKCGSLEIDLRNGTVRVDNEPVNLLPKEFALLQFFARNAGRYFTTEELLSHVWTAEAEVGIATVRVQVNNLRKKLKSAATLIQTSPGQGYRLVQRDSVS